MYEELIKRLGKRAVNLKEKFSRNAELLSELMEAADAIEEMQAGEKKFLRNISALEMENENLKRARRWIPVTERLPEEDGDYFVYGVWGSGKTAMSDCEYAVHDGYFRTAWNFSVTHWMPLPAPPKEE